MSRKVFLVLGLSVLLGLILPDALPPSIGQVSGDYFGANDTAIIARNNDMIPRHLQANFKFDDQGDLIVTTTSDENLDFIIVYQGELNPILEWCYTSAYNCSDELNINFGSSDSLFSFSFYDGLSHFQRPGKEPVKLGRECAKILFNDNGTFDLQVPRKQPISLEEFNFTGQPLPQNESLTQLSVRFQGRTCGADVKFPKVFLAYSETAASSSSSPESQTSATESPSNNSASSNSTGTLFTATSTSSSGMGTWEAVGIIGGSIVGVICISVIVGIVICLCVRRRRNKKKAAKKSKSGMKIVKLRGTRSMESVVTAIPAAAESAIPAAGGSAIPAARPPPKVVKTDSTQQESVASKISFAKLHTEPTQRSPSLATAIEKTVDFGLQKLKPFPDEGLKTAEERTKEPTDELPLLQTAIPKLLVDPSKPYSKLFADEYVSRGGVAIPKYQAPKIVPFLTQRINDKFAPPSQYTPDCLVYQAIRLPHVEERAAKLVQATVQANNQLYDLGFRRKMFRRSPDISVDYYVSGPTKSEQWLKQLEGGDFLRFIVAAAAKDIGGKSGEYEEDEKYWKQYLSKIDVPECFRQACLYGQSIERREFFTLATYYQMAKLMNDVADEKVLEKLPFPVPFLLELVREGPHYFAVEHTATSEQTGPQ